MKKCLKRVMKVAVLGVVTLGVGDNLFLQRNPPKACFGNRSPIQDFSASPESGCMPALGGYVPSSGSRPHMPDLRRLEVPVPQHDDRLVDVGREVLKNLGVQAGVFGSRPFDS